jgi:hypothetical protein
MIVLTMAIPSKPTPDYPLFAHDNGQSAKKINGKLRYYGPWDDPQGALTRYHSDDTQASNGRQPQVSRQSKVSQSTKPVKPHKDFPARTSRCTPTYRAGGRRKGRGRNVGGMVLTLCQTT